MKAIFCTDGSEASNHALTKSLEFLKKDTIVDIFYVIDWGYFPTYVTFPTEEEFMFSAKEAAKVITGKAEEILNSFGFSANKKDYVSGRPADEIIHRIKENDYELAILGAHGKKGIENWLGSVSSKVVSCSTIPVFISRPSKEENIIEIKEKNSILFTTDGSSCSFNAIRKTLELLDINNSFLDIVTVMPGMEALPLEISMDKMWLEQCLKKQKEISENVLLNSLNIFKEKKISPRDRISLEGNTAEEILRLAHTKGYDLIVLGSHGREGISEFLLGSISKRVLSQGYTSVLIVPSKKLHKNQ